MKQRKMMCYIQDPEDNEHMTKPVFHVWAGAWIDIDTRMAELIRILWLFDASTEACCQGSKTEWAYIKFHTMRDAFKFASMCADHKIRFKLESSRGCNGKFDENGVVRFRQTAIAALRNAVLKEWH